MKLFFFYLFFCFMAFSAACGMFMLKYHVVDKEILLAKLHKQIAQNNRSIHILRAELTNLNTPERLKILAEKNTTLRPIKHSQIIAWENVSEASKEEDKK